ncbi:MAG: metallophosphoesterase [Nitrospirales bacterium]|nr:metallophosphoesterase [Nitrospirales bacterium]
MRVTWATDIHLNFLNLQERASFFRSIVDAQPDAVFLTGDIAEAPSLQPLLGEMHAAVEAPLYFVLGNHDFYYGSISRVRADLASWSRIQQGLTYLTSTELVELTPTTVLIGHDGWGDGRYGNYHLSPVKLSDQELIEDFQDLNREEVLEKLRALGNEAARNLEEKLHRAVTVYPHVVCLTHVPPFKEACWYQGKMGNDDWLPYFACRAVGEVLMTVSQERPDCQIAVMCGHTHHEGVAHLRPNLCVFTGSAEYGAPCVQNTFELEELFEFSSPAEVDEGRVIGTDVVNRQSENVQ